MGFFRSIWQKIFDNGGDICYIYFTVEFAFLPRFKKSLTEFFLLLYNYSLLFLLMFIELA